MMLIYIVMMLITLTFAYCYDMKKNQYFAVLSVIPSILVAGFRYDVGTDYMFRYLPDFQHMQMGKSPSNLEWGFKIAVYAVQLVTDNFQLLLVCCAIGIYGIIFYNIYTYSNQVYISIIIFYIGLFFFDSMNVMRQYIAVALLVCAFMKLLDNKLKWFFLYLILAMMFHTISVVFLVVLIPYYLRTHLRLLSLGVILPMIIMPFSRQILNVLLRSTKYAVYFTDGFEHFVSGDLQVVMLAINGYLLLVFFYVIYQKTKVINDKTIMMYLFMQIVATYICVYTSVLYIVFRFIYLFSIFQIWSVPLFCGKIEDKNKKRLVMASIVTVYLMGLCYLTIMNNANGVLPYQMKWYVN